MNKETIVKLENVSKKFGKKTIIKNLDLDVYEGDRIINLSFDRIKRIE